MHPQPDSMAVAFDKAKVDPAAHFRVPEDVLEHSAFTQDQKREILQAWVQDATRLSESESEGMGGGEPAMLGRVLDALHCLDGTPDCPDPRLAAKPAPKAP